MTLTFPAVLERLQLKAFDLCKLIETFVRHEPLLPRELKRHLFNIEEKMLEALAFERGSSLYPRLIIACSDDLTSECPPAPCIWGAVPACERLVSDWRPGGKRPVGNAWSRSILSGWEGVIQRLQACCILTPLPQLFIRNALPKIESRRGCSQTQLTSINRYIRARLDTKPPTSSALMRPKSMGPSLLLSGVSQGRKGSIVTVHNCAICPSTRRRCCAGAQQATLRSAASQDEDEALPAPSDSHTQPDSPQQGESQAADGGKRSPQSTPSKRSADESPDVSPPKLQKGARSPCQLQRLKSSLKGPHTSCKRL